jgi:hypothetical protein
MRSNSYGIEPTKGLSTLVNLRVKKCRIDYDNQEKVYDGDLAIKVLQNITLMNNYGDLVSKPISSLKGAQVFYVF